MTEREATTADSTPRERFEQNASGIAATVVTGTWLAALLLDRLPETETPEDAADYVRRDRTPERDLERER